MLVEQGQDDLANSIIDIGGSNAKYISVDQGEPCLLYTSDAADD